MLIRFKVANFLSFKDEAEFSMVAGRERIHPDHVVRGKDDDPNLLRAALIYGANGAGKSNFVRAMDFAKKQITKPRIITPRPSRHHYNYNSFRLDPLLLESPSSFIFEFIVDSVLYEYGFRVRGNYVFEEWLTDLSKNTKVFVRKTDNEGNSSFEETNYVKKGAEKELLNFVQKSIIPTQLFLTHSVGNNIKWLDSLFEWFESSLNIVFPNTSDQDLEDKLNNDEGFRLFVTDFMQKAGTGISDVIVRSVRRIKPNSQRIGKAPLFEDGSNLVEEDDFETVLRMLLIHGNPKSGSVPLFIRNDESDGTQRLFDLMSPLYDLVNDSIPKVYIIDELERSLHANVSYMLLRNYLEHCQDHKSQLIATTHQTHLLDLSLLRRDEIWFAEKNQDGATQLYSLYEFNPRYDKKIEKEYLTGRFGAIPFLGNFEFKRKIEILAKSKK